LVEQPRGKMRREPGIEREAARGAEHRCGGAGEAAAILVAAQGAGALRDFGRSRSRIGQQRREQQRIVAGERRGRLAEQAERGGADPLRLAAKAGEVEIGLEYLVLGPARFERRRPRASGAALSHVPRWPGVARSGAR
jgi:hypothetical protein